MKKVFMLFRTVSVALLVGVVRIYQLTIKTILPPACRFHPSCSHYMIEALKKHGPVKGLLMGVYRILRCHPFSRGGVDPVPDTVEWRTLFVRPHNLSPTPEKEGHNET